MESTHSPVKLGVIGLGRSGWNIHINALRHMTDMFTVAAVSDPDQSRCRDAADEFGCQAYGDPVALANDPNVELVIVASPNHLHHPHTLQAFKAGKNVVCEKPMAATAAEADEMIQAAEQARRTLAPFQNWRYHPEFLKVQEIIASGDLGRIVEIKISLQVFKRRWDWQTLKAFGGGELNSTAPHFLDQALQLFGDTEPEVFCKLDRALTAGDADDHCKVILYGKDAPTIDLEITRACAYSQDLWLIMGTHGTLRGGRQHMDWKYVDFSKMPIRTVEEAPTPDRSYNSETYDWIEESWDKPDDLPTEPTLFYGDIYKTIRHGQPLVITPQSVRRQIAVLEKCHQLSPM